MDESNSNKGKVNYGKVPVNGRAAEAFDRLKVYLHDDDELLSLMALADEEIDWSRNLLGMRWLERQCAAYRR
jgi:hypothetical protein